MATIEPQKPVQLSQNWGVSFSDYKVRGEQVDFQDLMVAIAQNRAVTVEGEVAPLSTRIKNRNRYLEDLGQALSEATNKQASFASDDKGDKVMSGWFSAAPIRSRGSTSRPKRSCRTRRRSGSPFRSRTFRITAISFRSQSRVPTATSSSSPRAPAPP